MKTKTKILTKLLAVFAVMFLCLGVATISLGGGNSSATAAETTATTSTTTVKDVGFSGNIFKAANMYWGNGAATSNFSLDKNTTDGYDLKITATADNSDSWIIHDNKQKDKYWWAGCSYKVSFQYMASENAECSVTFISLINNEMKTQNGTYEVTPTTTLASAEYVVTVPDDYVHNGDNGQNTQRIVIKNFKKDDVLYLKNIKVEVLDNHVEGEVLRDMTGIQYTNYNSDTTKNHVTTQYKEVDNTTVYDIVGTGVNGNCCLGTDYFPWYAGITYELSFYIMTVNTAATSSWYLYPRAMVNGTGVTTLDCGINSYHLNGVISDWCKYTFKYTPTQTNNGANNYFGFVIGLAEDENIQIKDVTVTMSTDGLKNVLSMLRYSGDASKDTDFTYTYSDSDNYSTDDIDPIYGKVNKITYNADMSGNRLLWDRYVKWVSGATYTLIFNVKTTATTAVMSVQGKTEGWEVKELVSAYSVIKEAAVTDWKTVIKTFTIEDMQETTRDDSSNSNPNYLRFVLSGGKSGDVVYYTDVKVYANVSTVTVKIGENTTTDTVVTGSEYTLPTHTEVAGKTFIGWTVDNETLLSADTTITVTGDTTVNAVLLDFATQEGTYLRLSTDTPGLRFITDADKTAIETTLKTYYGDNAKFSYGMHVTAVDAENSAINGYMDIETTIWQKENKSFASAITGFSNKSQFCTATFTVTAYIKVISGTETITINATPYTASGSIVSLAETAYEDRSDAATDEYANQITTDSHDTSLNGKYSKYSTDELEIIWNLSQLNATSGTTDEGSAE